MEKTKERKLRENAAEALCRLSASGIEAGILQGCTRDCSGKNSSRNNYSRNSLPFLQIHASACLVEHLPAFTIPFFIPLRKLCWLRSFKAERGDLGMTRNHVAGEIKNKGRCCLAAMDCERNVRKCDNK